MNQNETIKAKVKTYILNEFLPGEDPNELTDSTALLGGSILDSLATVKLVAFLEEQYGVEFQPHEVTAEYLDTLAEIARSVEAKLVNKK